MTIAHFCIDVMKHELVDFAPADQEQVRQRISHVKRVMRRMDIATVNIAYAPAAAPIIGDFKTVQRLMLQHDIQWLRGSRTSTPSRNYSLIFRFMN